MSFTALIEGTSNSGALPGEIKNRAKPQTPHAKRVPQKRENYQPTARHLRPGESGVLCFIARVLYHTPQRLSSVFAIFLLLFPFLFFALQPPRAFCTILQGEMRRFFYIQRFSRKFSPKIVCFGYLQNAAVAV
jgi:hypothetical protein